MFEIPFEVALVDGIGYAGAALSIWAMYGQTMIKLRTGVVVGNAIILIFGILAASWPTAIMHGILLPLNGWRLFEMVRLVKGMKASADDAYGYLEHLIPFMTTRKIPAGETLFKAGDVSNELILIESGSVRLEDLDISVGPGELFGEIGMFTPGNQRTATAVAETDCTIASMSHDALMQLYYQNPEFGLTLVRVVVSRLLDNWHAAEEARERAVM